MSAKDSLVSASQPIIPFVDAAEFSRWLAKNHADHPGIWLKIAKKAAGHPSVTYAEALEVALCHGWIDGQRKGFDNAWFLQKFTRRGPRSLWSKINVGHVGRLTRDRRMRPAGLAAVAAAKADGRWKQAYAPFRSAEVPADFLKALARFPKAKAFFDALNKTNRYAIVFRLHTAKRPETRARRLQEFVAMMRRSEKFH